MASNKSTKRALLTSALAIFMCVTMLIGTTFAWFTDTASTAVNKIQSGTLDVALEMYDGTNWVDAEGKTLSWKKAAGAPADEQVLWEPGCTYELPELRIVNNGNLALKYKIQITGIQGDAKLNEVIDWTINDVAINLTEEHLTAGQTGDSFTIKGHMQETAGNEYQNLTIDGIGITVFATQDTVENDSFGDQYDKDAPVVTYKVNPTNVQDYLDGKYASLKNAKLVLEAGDYGVLYLGRPTKYVGSNTEYFCQTHNFTTMDAEAFKAHYADGQWHTTPKYSTNLEDLMIVGEDGAEVAGLVFSTGHSYGDVYDYVRDIDYTSGSAYYSTAYVNNVTVENVAFTGQVNICTSDATTVVDGVAFRNCSFTTGGTAPDNRAAIRYYNENNNGNVKNLTVENCTFTNCYQGVYTSHIYGVSVTNSTFDTTGHNAIAIQDFHGAGNHGKVVITGNTFNNIGDRIIRFNNVGADTQITIKNNTATNSGDADGQVIKATSLADGIKYDISGNSWGDGKTVANTEFADK